MPYPLAFVCKPDRNAIMLVPKTEISRNRLNLESILFNSNGVTLMQSKDLGGSVASKIMEYFKNKSTCYASLINCNADIHLIGSSCQSTLKWTLSLKGFVVSEPQKSQLMNDFFDSITKEIPLDETLLRDLKNLLNNLNFSLSNLPQFNPNPTVYPYEFTTIKTLNKDVELSTHWEHIKDELNLEKIVFNKQGCSFHPGNEYLAMKKIDDIFSLFEKKSRDYYQLIHKTKSFQMVDLESFALSQAQIKQIIEDLLHSVHQVIPLSCELFGKLNVELQELGYDVSFNPNHTQTPSQLRPSNLCLFKPNATDIHFNFSEQKLNW